MFHSLELWVNLFLLTNLILMSSQDVCYRKGPGGNFHSLEVFLFLFSAASRKVYNALLKTSPVDSLSALFQCLCQKLFSVTITLIKFLLHKALSD